ncbi:MAG: aminoglycoside phosphotransferase, partial [Woeseiaceae bacterium]|nr:aminoglycoside phosphotransferase [Woeseiaceae bacterium]
MAHSKALLEESQATLIASLLEGCGYPHPVASCELLETHISWVILSGDFAYKIKKSVRLDFLDFSSLPKRRHFCEEELRLNRRFAPELYLEVVPICGSAEDPAIGGSGRAIEYALKMVQFPQSARLDQQLKEGLLQDEDVVDLAETVARYHTAATVIEYADERESVQKVRAPMLENFAPLRQVIDMDLLTRVQRWT